MLQHPVPLEPGNPAVQMNETMKAVVDLDCQVFVISPNADAGGKAMIETIKNYESCKNVQTFHNIDHLDFLHLLKLSSVIVGNSSSGIIEAPSFGVPAVNIGTRQKGRQKGDNIIDTGYNSHEIANAIDHALNDTEFRNNVKNTKNPYGEGNSSEKIVDILNKIVITPDLLQKRMMY